MECNTSLDQLSYKVIGAAIEVHRLKGPGLLESIYLKCMERELEIRKIESIGQLEVKVEYKGITFHEGLKIDLLIENRLIVELKAVEKIVPIHKAQLLSYMKLLGVPVGLLINFHEPVLKNGIIRLARNQPEDGVKSCEPHLG